MKEGPCYNLKKLETPGHRSEAQDTVESALVFLSFGAVRISRSCVSCVLSPRWIGSYQTMTLPWAHELLISSHCRWNAQRGNSDTDVTNRGCRGAVTWVMIHVYGETRTQPLSLILPFLGPQGHHDSWHTNWSHSHALCPHPLCGWEGRGLSSSSLTLTSKPPEGFRGGGCEFLQNFRVPGRVGSGILRPIPLLT